MSVENEEILHFLKDLGIKEISKNEKKALFEIINKEKNLSMTKKELELLYSLNRILIESYSSVSLSNMVKLYNDIDKEVLIELFITLHGIKSKFRDDRTALVEFRKAAEKILVNNKKVNFVIKKMVAEEVSKIDSIRNVLYFGMLDTQKADKLFSNCRRRSKHFLNNCDVENLSNLVEYLKKNYKLSDDELVDISSKCATFFAFSSAGKIKVLDDTINEFKIFISNSIKNNPQSLKVSKLLDRDFKDVIVNSSTFLTSNPDSIKDTIRFLKGEALGSIYKGVSDNLYNVKGEFTPAQLAKIYSESITSLTTSVDKIVGIYRGISKVYKDKYDVDLDVSKLINGRNFASISQLRNEDFDSLGKINEIFDLLKPFVNEKEMENLLQNNLSFLIAEETEVKQSLKNAILTSGNNDELKVNVLSKIKNHFDRNEGYDFSKNAMKNESISVDKAKKVILNDMDEESIVNILSKLESSEEEIASWKKKWKDEEKELRELEVQLKLEEILESLYSLDSMIGTNSYSYDGFIEETLTIKKLLEEIYNDRNEILNENKLNKICKALDAKVEDKLIDVANKIDSNIETVIKEYGDNIEKISGELNELINTKKKFNDTKTKLEEISNDIDQRQITDETLKNQLNDIDEISKLIEMAEKRNKKANETENKAGDLVETFYDALCQVDIDGAKLLRKNLDMIQADNAKAYDATYLFTLFVYVLVKEDLIADDGFLENEGRDIEAEHLAFKYNDYRVLLNQKQLLVADNIYNSYVQSAGDKSEIFDELTCFLDEKGINTVDVRTIKKAIGALYKLMGYYKDKHGEEARLLANKKMYENQLERLNIDEVEDNISKLEETIADYNLLINDLKLKKLNKK